MTSTQTEYWLRGPVAGIPLLLQPAAHAILQARMEVSDVLVGFCESNLWKRPSQVASVAFHLQHMAGVLDRMLTYAKGEQLNQQQLDYLEAEGKENKSITLSHLINHFSNGVDSMLTELRHTNENVLLAERRVGRKQLPGNVIGLLFHAAEHIQRHTGQLLVTVRILSDTL